MKIWTSAGDNISGSTTTTSEEESRMIRITPKKGDTR